MIMMTISNGCYLYQLTTDYQTGVSGNSRSRPFPRIKASDSHSLIMGMDFFIPFPFPNFGNFFSFPSPSRLWECLFSFPSRSRIVGMDFFSFPPPSRICHFTDRNQNGNWNTVRDTRLPIFTASSAFLTTIYIEKVNWAREFKSEYLKRPYILLSFVANDYAKVLIIVNKIILFWLLFIKSGRDNNKKREDYQEWRMMGLRMFGPKLLLTQHIF